MSNNYADNININIHTTTTTTTTIIRVRLRRKYFYFVYLRASSIQTARAVYFSMYNIQIAKQAS